MTTARLWGPSKIVAVDINQERLDLLLSKALLTLALILLTVMPVMQLEK
jgi:predicted RNA methylase